MLIKHRQQIDITFEKNNIEIIHDRDSATGPKQISYNGKVIAKDFSCYVDDRKDSAAVVRKSKGYTKGGVGIVECESYLPIGSEIHFSQKYCYNEDSVRISTDINLHTGTTVKRHFGIGCFFMPGKWTKYHLTPAPRHLHEGGTCSTFEIPKVDSKLDKPIMIGHWHRPPLSIVFEHEDGFFFELGTGFDVWRWEKCLGAGPEAASYKLFLTEEGIQVVREPLMTCQEFTPQAGQYRFNWYLSWGDRKPNTPSEDVLWINPLKEKLPETVDKVGLDVADFEFHSSFCRVTTPEDLALDKKTDKPCFAHNKTQKDLRTAFRKLKEKNPTQVWIKNLTTGVCCNPSHVSRRGEALYHNDSGYILDFMDWVRNTFKESEVIIATEADQKTLLKFDL